MIYKRLQSYEVFIFNRHKYYNVLKYPLQKICFKFYKSVTYMFFLLKIPVNILINFFSYEEIQLPIQKAENFYIILKDLMQVAYL